MEGFLFLLTSPRINSSFLMVCLFPRCNRWAITGFSHFFMNSRKLVEHALHAASSTHLGLNNQPPLRRTEKNLGSLTDPKLRWKNASIFCDPAVKHERWLVGCHWSKKAGCGWLWFVAFFFGWPSGTVFRKSKIYDICGWETRLGLRIFTRPANHMYVMILEAMYTNTYILIWICSSKHFCQVSAS